MGHELIGGEQTRSGRLVRGCIGKCVATCGIGYLLDYRENREECQNPFHASLPIVRKEPRG
jgi:hypothetical protein